MSAGAGIGLFICIVIIVIVGVGFKINTDCDTECLKSKVEYLNMLYHNLDKRWGDIYDIVKLQQEEIKKLRGMLEPESFMKKCCCGNCRFYYELNNQSSACLNVNVNNKHKGSSTLYADGKSITWGTIKCVQPNDCCKWYEPKEASDA